MHFEQPRCALCPTNPHTLRAAGMSQATHISAALISKLSIGFICRITPFQSCWSSSTKGFRKELMCLEGSRGPGITPTITIFSAKKRSLLGKFWTARYNTPTECFVCFYGWNQSTFRLNAKLYGSDRNGIPFTTMNCCQTLPSYMSLRLSGSCCRVRHSSHFFRKSGWDNSSFIESIILL